MATRQVGPPQDLGPCCVIWDPDTANLELGPTFGTVTFRSEDNVESIFHDKHGVTPVNAVYTGRVPTLEVPMTSPNLLQLETVIEASYKKKSLGKTKILWVPNPVGGAVFADSKEIILKPAVDQVCATNTAKWLHIFRAFPIANLELGFDNSGQRVYNVLFMVFPDDTSGLEGKLWRLGPAS